MRELVMGMSISVAAAYFYITKKTQTNRVVADFQFAYGLMFVSGVISLLWTSNRLYCAYNLLQLGTLLVILSLFDFSLVEQRRREAIKMVGAALAGSGVFLIPVMWSAIEGKVDASGRTAASLNYFQPAKIGVLAAALWAYSTTAFVIGKKRFWINLVMTCLSGFALFASAGKGGITAAAIAIPIVLVYFSKPRKSRILILLLLALLSTPFLMTLKLGLFEHLMTYKRISEQSEGMPTLVFRFHAWSATIKSLFKDVPTFLFGNGPGFSASQMYDFIVNGQVTRSAGAHQSILQILSESGMVGGGAFMALIVITLKRVVRTRQYGRLDSAAAPMLTGWITLFIGGMLDQIYSFPVGNMFCLFLCFMVSLTLIVEVPALGLMSRKVDAQKAFHGG